MDMNPVTSQTSGDERLLLLAMALDTRSGLTFSELVDRGLLGDPGQVEVESLRRTFQRYREHLEEMGVRVTEADHGAGVRYKVDARYTYAEPRCIDLERDEALTLVTLLSLYLEVAEKYDKQIGIHAHNNQQLAFANTIECLSLGASFLDATVSGMGRGAGNCYMESLLAFLRNPRYNINPIMSFVEKHILPLRHQGVVWGYDIPYLLTGVFNAHPSSAINFIRDGRSDYTMFYQELLDNTF